MGLMAREYLEEIGKLQRRIDNLRDEIKSIRDHLNLLPGVTFDGDRIQTSTTDSKVIRTIEELTDRERELTDLVGELHEDRMRRIHMIGKLNNKDQITVLYARYIGGQYWWEIEAAIGKGQRWTKQIHADALMNLEAILQGEDAEKKI